jgi:hypothetical protein
VPKRNVYFDQETADLIKAHPELNVSALCQQAVRDAVNTSVDPVERAVKQTIGSIDWHAAMQIERGPHQGTELLHMGVRRRVAEALEALADDDG